MRANVLAAIRFIVVWGTLAHGFLDSNWGSDCDCGGFALNLIIFLGGLVSCFYLSTCSGVEEHFVEKSTWCIGDYEIYNKFQKLKWRKYVCATECSSLLVF